MRRLVERKIDPCLDMETSIALLLSAVTEWAERNTAVASALGFAPPLCAVEDLLVLRPGQYSAVHAAATLTRTIKEAVG